MSRVSIVPGCNWEQHNGEHNNYLVVHEMNHAISFMGSIEREERRVKKLRKLLILSGFFLGAFVALLAVLIW